MELELNSLDWNVNELEHKLELEDMKLTLDSSQTAASGWCLFLVCASGFDM